MKGAGFLLRGAYLKGQSVVELAVFCTIVIFIFSTLLTYGQRLSIQQETKMQAFRKAMAKAYSKNAAVSYTLKKDTRFFNPFSGIGQGQVSSAGGSSTVMWQKGMPGDAHSNGKDQNFAYYDVNGTILHDEDEGLPRYTKETYGNDGTPGEAKIPVSVYKEEVYRNETFETDITRDEKKDSESGPWVYNKKHAVLSDNIKTRVYVRYDASVNEESWNPDIDLLPSYIYESETNPYDGYQINRISDSPIEQGVYFNQDTGRLEYSSDMVDNKVKRDYELKTEK